jgi:alpha-amylase
MNVMDTRYRGMAVAATLVALALLFSLPLFAGQPKHPRIPASYPKSDVMLQGFYWNSTPGGIWWDSLAKLAPRIASAGIGGVWVPSPAKGASGQYSMGYDLYDHFDFGEYNQQGSVATRFGTRQQLVNMINVFHANGVQVYADAVMGHMNGGEQKVPYDCKPYPSYPDSGWLVFNYPAGSGRFKKTARSFYPNQTTCDVNPPYHGPSDPIYKFGEVLAHSQSNVKDSLIVWGQYLRQALGFDGFRIDEAKTIDPIFMGPWLAQANSNGFAVAEVYDGTGNIQNWLYWVQQFGGNCTVFDFPLRFDLKSMCDNTPGSWDMNWLDGSGLVNNGTSGFNVTTFVDNHDLDRIGWDGSIDNGHSPIVNNKMMAYAYIMFSEGKPCIWFRDYFTYGLDGPIDTLVWIRQNYIWGGTTKRSGLSPYYIGSSDDQTSQSKYLYVARRDGGNGHPAAYIVINAHPTEWRGVWVNSSYPNQPFRDFTGASIDHNSQGDGRVDLWAPPRSYAIFIPDTTQKINFPPFVSNPPVQYAYINTPYQYQLMMGDPNRDSLTIKLTGQPSWLTLSPAGLLSGTPGSADKRTSTVHLLLTDPSGDTASATWTLNVVDHPVMDGTFEGTNIWGSPLSVGDTTGWEGARAKNLYVTTDSTYVYVGADIRAAKWMTWAFLINTRYGGGSSDSWSRSITYTHNNLPDYIIRGTFTNYTEIHTWNGSAWSGIGTQAASTEYGADITLDTLQDGWVEARIPRASLGNPKVFAVQFFLTGDQNYEATFAACPTDQITTAWSGITTHLHIWAYQGTKRLTGVTLQSPQSATVPSGGNITASARTFGLGITDSAGAGAGIQTWIGLNSSNTNPATWSTWIPAAYAADFSGSDEYRASVGSTLSGGTWYYASRFQYNGGAYQYGGWSIVGGGAWDSISNVSGILTVVDPPAVPILSGPSDSAINQPLSPTLQWQAVSGAQTYRLQVSSSAGFGTTVFDDSTLTGTSKKIGPIANGIYFWHVRAKNIAGTSAWSGTRMFSVFVPSMLVTVHTSWNMVSLPLTVMDGSRQSLFPHSISNAFTWGSGSSYLRQDTLHAGPAYWLKFPSPDTVTLTGYPAAVETIQVRAGWNMIGSVSSEISTSSIIERPRPMIRSPFFTYASNYRQSTTIIPGAGYWVKTDTSGFLVLQSGPVSYEISLRSQVVQQGVFDTLRVTDSAGHDAILLISRAQAGTSGQTGYELPPVPPEDLFDVRFSSQRYCEGAGADEVKELPVLLQGVVYPAVVMFKSHDAQGGLSIKIDGNTIPLTGGGSITVEHQPARLAVAVSGKSGIPQSWSLAQNFPNPFNPSTAIRFGLPVAANIRLSVFDLLGREVALLFNGKEDAGYHTVAWNGVDQSGYPVPSGVYLCRVTAIPADGNAPAWTAVRKMILVR